MNLYEHIIQILSYIFIFSGLTSCIKNENLKISETGVYPIVPCAVGLKFYVLVNNTSFLDDFDVELVPDQCCLEDGFGVDCDVLDVVGNCLENIPKGKSSTLNLVAPILDPYERKGYCSAYLDSKSVYRKRNVVTMRDAIKIPFDTRLKQHHLNPLPSGIEHCKGFDEDPLNQCQPVECELFYNGKKSFYSRVKKRCVEVPNCVSDDDELPNAVYDPVSNTCIQEEPITKDDFDYIKGLKHSKGRIAKDIVIIKKLKEEPQQVIEMEEIKTNRSNQTFFPDSKKDKFLFWNNIMCYVQKNKSGVVFLFWIILFQCALICIMIYYFARRCSCKSKKDVEKKYFNYRQDVSVTTPLIGLDTMDTETTCQFMSESSHVDRKIQCYKACQKDNGKLSLSDDILTKCLNRRNWDRKPVRSEAIDSRIGCDGSKTFETLYMSTKKEDQKVVFENDFVKSCKNDNRSNRSCKDLAKRDDKKDVSKQIVNKKTDDASGSKVFMSEREIQCLTYQYKDSKPKVNNTGNPIQNSGLSEKEIRCHSYNCGVQLSDDDSIKASSHSYSKLPSTNHMQNLYTTDTKTNTDALSIGRQASAQASFTNDSIDDYLSERGINFLTGENISKYSFSDNSIKSASSRTSKCSNSNIMKRVLSYLRRDKNGPASEPSGKKPQDEVSLELLHMSKATMYSSSNNDTECFKNITARAKDSRTSL